MPYRMLFTSESCLGNVLCEGNTFMDAYGAHVCNPLQRISFACSVAPALQCCIAFYAIRMRCSAGGGELQGRQPGQHKQDQCQIQTHKLQLFIAYQLGCSTAYLSLG